MTKHFKHSLNLLMPPNHSVVMSHS